MWPLYVNDSDFTKESIEHKWENSKQKVTIELWSPVNKTSWNSTSYTSFHCHKIKKIYNNRRTEPLLKANSPFMDNNFILKCYPRLIHIKTFHRNTNLPWIITNNSDHITDNGKELKIDLFQILTEELGIKHQFLSPYYLQANGILENFLSLLKDLCQKTHRK